MSRKIDPRFISDAMTTDTELAGEASTRASEDTTFVKLDGSRPLTGNLNFNNFNSLNVNLSSNKIVVTPPKYTTSTLNGSLTLSSASESVHFITGSASGFSVIFPNATTLTNGTNFEIYNRSAFPITLKYFDGSTIGVLSSESVSSLILQDNSTQKGIYSPFTVEVAQAAGVANYNTTSTSPFSTSSAAYVAVTDFTITPAAGTYAVWVNSSNQSTNNNSMNYIALYKAGSIVQSSERVAQSVASNFVFQLSTFAIISVNGAESLSVYAKVSTGTLTVNSRTIAALRLGPAT